MNKITPKKDIVHLNVFVKHATTFSFKKEKKEKIFSSNSP